MEFKHENNKFYLGDSPDNNQAEISYSHGGQTVIIDRTFVSDELKGQGVAKKLVKAVADWARQEGYKIMPLCWYAKKEMESNPEYHDLLV